jgi:pimeloyl-ACP methyl ester carboxylesterase
MTDGLLFLHAWPVDARMWEPQLGALPLELRVAAPDHPGFGGAASAGDVMTMDLAARNALAAMDAAGIDRAVVCGSSIGGYIAFEIWRQARERVIGFVLANTRAVGDTEEAAAGRRALAERLRSEGNVFADDPPPLLAADAPPELERRVREFVAEQPASSIAAAVLGMAERPDSTPDLETIDVPTLVITSSGDRLIPPEVTTEMAAAIPDARFELIEGVGHLTNLEAPEVFNRLLLDHLAACGLP